MSTILASNLAGPSSTGTAAILASLNGDALAGHRNRLINGGMQIDQRNSGASVSSSTGVATYTVDRWYVYATGAAVTAQRITSSNTTFTSAVRITGAASNTAVSFGQRIEVQNSYDLAGKTVTLSFYAASSASITLTWKAYYAGAADNFTTQTQSNTGTQATTSTLTKYSATFTLPSAATTGVSIEIGVAGAFTSGTFDLTGVQLELGSVATPFERRSFGQELVLCQRYYEKSYDVGTAPGTVTSNGAIGVFPAAYAVYFQVQFKAIKRVVATCTGYSPQTGATGKYNWNMSTPNDTALTGTIANGQYGITFFNSSSPGNVSAYLHFTADAEL
jgi:hypothetical protein